MSKRTMSNSCGRGALAFCLLLAGCFTSSQPKFPASSAVPALGSGGHFAAYERQSDSSFKRDDSFDVKHRADGGYDFTDIKGKVTPISLHRIRGDLYVAQAVNDKKDHTDYAVLRLQGQEGQAGQVGQEILAYPSQCDKQDAAKLKALGVEIRKYQCVIDRVADPVGLFATINLGEARSKMVRE